MLRDINSMLLMTFDPHQVYTHDVDKAIGEGGGGGGIIRNSFNF